MELAPSALVSAPENIVRPVESTADPTSPSLDGHDTSVKTEPAAPGDTTGSKAATETSANTSENQNQEPTSGVCSTAEAHALASETEATKTQETPAASSSPSDKQANADIVAEYASEAAASTPLGSETPPADIAAADPVIFGDSTIDELLAAAAPIAPLPTSASPSEQSALQPNKTDKHAKKEKKV